MLESCYRPMFELGWRGFFHRTRQLEGDDIFGDLHHPQAQLSSECPPRAVLEATTGIEAIDGTLRHLVEHGTLHDHARMWTAAVARNLGRTGWKAPARWLHPMPEGEFPSVSRYWKQVRKSVDL